MTIKCVTAKQMHVNVTGIYKCFLEAFSTFYEHQTGTGGLLRVLLLLLQIPGNAFVHS